MIVPDRHGTGTNALLLTPPDVIDAGVRRGLVRPPRALARARPARRCRSPSCRSLGLDVDTPDDLAALRRALAARRAAPRAPARCSSEAAVA